MFYLAEGLLFKKLEITLDVKKKHLFNKPEGHFGDKAMQRQYNTVKDDVHVQGQPRIIVRFSVIIRSKGKAVSLFSFNCPCHPHNCLAVRQCHLKYKGKERWEKPVSEPTPKNSGVGVPGIRPGWGWRLKFHRAAACGGKEVSCGSVPYLLTIVFISNVTLYQSQLIKSLSCPKLSPRSFQDKVSTPWHDVQGPP